jgi:hypothetical protein
MYLTEDGFGLLMEDSGTLLTDMHPEFGFEELALEDGTGTLLLEVAGG